MIKINEKKKLKILVFISLALFAGTSFWYIIQDSKPKSVVDVLNTITSEEAAENLKYAEGADTHENIDLLVEYRNLDGTMSSSQYFILDKGGGKVLLVETTPGLIDNELEIKRMQEIDRSIYDNDLQD